MPYRGLGSGITRALKSGERIELTNDLERDKFVATLWRDAANVGSNVGSDVGCNITTWNEGLDDLKDRDVVSAGENIGENIGENTGENYLTERQVLIYSALKQNGENTAKSLARMLGMSQRTVEREISYLRKHGFIDKDGTKKGSWTIIK